MFNTIINSIKSLTLAFKTPVTINGGNNKKFTVNSGEKNITKAM